MVWVLLLLVFFFFPFVKVGWGGREGGGEGEKSAEETVGISKEKYLFKP